MTQPNSLEIQQAFQALQAEICQGLEQLDGQIQFQADDWTRPEGGGGRTATAANGQIIAKGGVAFSAVHGPASEPMLKTLGMSQMVSPSSAFLATGVSIVLHPLNPLSPIIHMNVRYFELGSVWWFGGGIDLTPHYVQPRLAQAFHQGLADYCQEHHPAFYPDFKAWADRYFYLPHRKESRGIGGIFFDRLNEDNPYQCSRTALWDFVLGLGRCFVPLYQTQIEATKQLSYGPQELEWQALRRSRYVEFNLVWDRGTQFGLQTNGRTESILLSMPPQAQWVYNHQAPAHSPEAQTLAYLREQSIDWLGFSEETKG